MAPHVPLLVVQKPKSLKDLGSVIELLQKVIKKCCSSPASGSGYWHISPTRDSGGPSWWRSYDFAPIDRGRGTRARGRHGRGNGRYRARMQGKRRYKEEAMVTTTEPHLQHNRPTQFYGYPNTGLDRDNDNRAVKLLFDHLYYIDSACNPHYFAKPLHRGVQPKLHVRITNSSQCYAYTVHNLRVRVGFGAALRLRKVAYAPDFENNLLAICALPYPRQRLHSRIWCGSKRYHMHMCIWYFLYTCPFWCSHQYDQVTL